MKKAFGLKSLMGIVLEIPLLHCHTLLGVGIDDDAFILDCDMNTIKSTDPHPAFAICRHHKIPIYEVAL